MSNFLQFYFRYVASRGNDTAYAPFGRGALGYYLELGWHIGFSVLIFYLTESLSESSFWIWVGRVSLAYAVLQAYAWLWWFPYQDYRQPLIDKNRDALKRQHFEVLRAINVFCHDLENSRGKNPTSAAKVLMDRVIVYHQLCATNSPKFSQIHTDLAEAAKEFEIEAMTLELLGRDNVPVPVRFKLSTVLPGGNKFTFTERVVL